MRFCHLHTHSHYSLLDGLAKIDDLVARAKALGMDAVALTDHGNLYGAVEFYKKAKAAGIKPILGVEAYIAPGSHTDKTATGDERYHHLILLAENDIGWKNLIKLTTIAHLDGFYYKPRMDKALLRQYHEGLIALSACLSGEVARSLFNNRYDDAKRAALEYNDIFGAGNFFLEIGHHPGIKDTLKPMEGVRRIAKETGIPLVATQDIHYLLKEDAEYHDILLAVQTGNNVASGDRLTLRDDDFSMRSPDEMAKLFAAEPEAIENTAKIADRCNVKLELNTIRLPKFPLPDGQTSSIAYLKELLNDRLPKRFPVITQVVTDRMNYELGVIEKMGFADYFLIVQDFINWAKERGVVVGPGRGSAAGSLVSYVSGITDVDPIKYDLLFERFLNPDRIQMPDIDVDITDRRRDEVFGYLQEKYGVDHVAHIITFGTMAARAALRDVGRALGISYGFCDQLAKLIPFNQDLTEALKNVVELKEQYDKNADAKKIIDAAMHLEGVARHASVHACGTVISNEPLTHYLPLQRAPQDDHVIMTQFEMHSVEDLGLLKMDLLGLKNLTIIEDAVQLINAARPDGKRLDIHDIPVDDAKTFALLQSAETTGIFQLESSGMRRYLKELKPTSIEDITAMVALYRPGPMELIPTYINRKHGREKMEYLHPMLEPILSKTYGVGVYQEQMMRIARDLAGYSLAEADTLRKAIGKKIKKLLDEQQAKLVAGMIKNGIPPHTANAIWELFPPFARYGFNRSHAVCYAMVGYQTAYLRAHYPVEFMASLLNADAGDIDRTAFLISETKHAGHEVLPPDINKSMALFTPDGADIRFGLAAIKNVGQNIVDAIIVERDARGPFGKLSELLQRVQHKDLNKKSLESLIKCGALDSFGIERATLLGNIDDILRIGGAIKRYGREGQSGLFVAAPSQNTFKLKQFPTTDPKTKLTWEKELLGLFVSDHPLNMHKAKLTELKCRTVKQALAEKSEMNYFGIGGIVTKMHKIVTKKGQPMLFANIEDFGGTIEAIVFPEAFAKTSATWKENAVLLLMGRMSWRGGEGKFICERAQEL